MELAKNIEKVLKSLNKGYDVIIKVNNHLVMDLKNGVDFLNDNVKVDNDKYVSDIIELINEGGLLSWNKLVSAEVNENKELVIDFHLDEETIEYKIFEFMKFIKGININDLIIVNYEEKALNNKITISDLFYGSSLKEAEVNLGNIDNYWKDKNGNINIKLKKKEVRMSNNDFLKKMSKQVIKIEKAKDNKYQIKTKNFVALN